GMNFGIRWDGVDGKMREFLFLAAMGGIATGDYDGDGLADVFVTSPSGGSRLFHNEGGFRFRDVTEVCGLMDEALWGTGATFGDLDNDGDLDLWLCVYGGRDRVYLNEGPGNDGSGSESGVVGVVRFVESGDGCGVPAGRASMGVALADYDLDGDLDAYVTTTGKDPPPGTEFKVRFEEREDGVEVPYVLDELSEYWELLYLPGDRVRRIEAGQRDHLLRNDGIGSDGKMTFKDVSRDAGIGGAYFTLSARWWDYDGDCWPDLYVSNDYTGPDQLWRNLGDGTFEEVIRDVVPHTPWFSMGADAGDLNGDGLLDFVVADMAASSHYREKVTMGNMDDMGWFLDWAEPRQYMRNAVYLNSGAGRMLEAGHLTGLAATDWTWSVRMEDFDSDGRLDVFFTNGAVRDTMNSDLTRFAEAELKPGSEEWVKFWKEQPVRAEKNRVYRNRGGVGF
ncbi:MAG: VCBS repeat-containing protein, partial [Verrucomicrobiales bacterium]|nr:VCBS repeat-containing protein [Verrucomicrobiales bacterium]